MRTPYYAILNLMDFLVLLKAPKIKKKLAQLSPWRKAGETARLGFDPAAFPCDPLSVWGGGTGQNGLVKSG